MMGRHVHTGVESHPLHPHPEVAGRFPYHCHQGPASIRRAPARTAELLPVEPRLRQTYHQPGGTVNEINSQA